MAEVSYDFFNYEEIKFSSIICLKKIVDCSFQREMSCLQLMLKKWFQWEPRDVNISSLSVVCIEGYI